MTNYVQKSMKISYFDEEQLLLSTKKASEKDIYAHLVFFLQAPTQSSFIFLLVFLRKPTLYEGPDISNAYSCFYLLFG